MLCLKLIDYQISSDAYNYILQERREATRGKNVGKEIVVDLGYYSTLEGALRALLHKELTGSDHVSAEMLLARIEQAEKRIIDAVREQCG